MKSVILSVLLILSLATSVEAEIAIGITAEWLSHESSLVALATPVNVQTIPGPGNVWFTKTRFRIDDIIKGPQSVGDTVTVFDFSHNKTDSLPLVSAQKKGSQILVFATIAKHKFKEIDGKYMLTQTHLFKSAYSVGKKTEKLYTVEFQSLVKFDEFLRLTRKQVGHETDLRRRYWSGTIKKKSLEVPFDSEAHRELYAGSACYLWVPDYVESNEK